MRIAIPALALCLALPTLTLAHGPTRQKVTESVTIGASPQKTWDAILNTPMNLDEIVLAEALWAASKSLLSGSRV